MRFVWANPLVVGAVVLMLLVGTFWLGREPYAADPQAPHPSDLVEHAEHQGAIVVDPDTLQRMDFDTQTQPTSQSRSYWADLWQRNRLLILLILYTALITLLYVYHEKQRRKQARYEQQKLEEMMLAQLQQAQERTQPIHHNMWETMERYRELLEPELPLCAIKEQLEVHPECALSDGIIVSARKVLEKILIPLYDAYIGDEEEPSLHEMIYRLSKQGILGRSMTHDARAIQSIGNRAAHTRRDTRVSLEARDAIATLSYLLRLLQELDATQRPNKTAPSEGSV